MGANGYKVNAYTSLRWYFTDSELRQQGFPITVGLNVASSDECWENDPHAPGYYKKHGIEMPPEVHAASIYRHNEEAKLVILCLLFQESTPTPLSQPRSVDCEQSSS